MQQNDGLADGYLRIGMTERPSKAQPAWLAGRATPSTPSTVAMKSIVTTGAQDSRAGPFCGGGPLSAPPKR